jgi:2-keto-4-pentenoate hydratase
MTTQKASKPSSRRAGPGAGVDRQRAERTAQWLVEQHRDRRPFTGLPADCAVTNLDEAYAVQDAFVAIKARACGEPIGWKIALSNPAMQRFLGFHEPTAGRLFRRQVVGAPGHARAAAYGRLAVEFEIAVELGADLPPKMSPYTRNEVAEAVAALRPAFELVDDRGADYREMASHGLQTVADNAWSEGAVLGERRTDWRRLDLAELDGFVALDGQQIGAGSGRDLMGHPLDALAWLATHASRRGPGMRAGELAILGSLVVSKFPRAGQRFDFALEGFDPISLYIE